MGIDMARANDAEIFSRKSLKRRWSFLFANSRRHGKLFPSLSLSQLYLFRREYRSHSSMYNSSTRFEIISDPGARSNSLRFPNFGAINLTHTSPLKMEMSLSITIYFFFLYSPFLIFCPIACCFTMEQSHIILLAIFFINIQLITVTTIFSNLKIHSTLLLFPSLSLSPRNTPAKSRLAAPRWFCRGGHVGSEKRQL